MKEEADQNNFCVLSKYGKSLNRSLKAHKTSPLGNGSEFIPTNVLEVIFRYHPNWSQMKRNILSYASDWPTVELDLESRVKDLKEVLVSGNHKGATKNPELQKTSCA